jgi:hypothetical protein
VIATNPRPVFTGFLREYGDPDSPVTMG